MKEERYLKDREAIVRADIWKEITSSCKGLRTELGYTNIQIVEFLKEITKTFERDQLWILKNDIDGFEISLYFYFFKASSIFFIESGTLLKAEVNLQKDPRDIELISPKPFKT